MTAIIGPHSLQDGHSAPLQRHGKRKKAKDSEKPDALKFEGFPFSYAGLAERHARSVGPTEVEGSTSTDVTTRVTESDLDATVT